jgi:hypothetical protein
MRNKTITVDLESWSSSPTVLGNTTGGIYSLQPYQQVLWDRMNQGGFKKGQLTLYSAVQHTGKSLYQKMVLNKLYGTNLCNEIMLPMKPAPKYRFSRAKWYEAKVPKDQQAAFAWCVKQFGPEPTITDAWTRWYFNVERTFRFRDAKDYEWFLLRWS